MRLGLLIECEEGLTWERWRLILHVAERLQFHSVWVSDHLESPWPEADKHGLEAWAALTFAAAQTRRIRLGSLVSPVTFRQPAVFARTVESVHELARGRLIVGLGLGWNAAEHKNAGLPFPPIDQRALVLERTVEVLPDVPILIGGAGATSLHLAARFAQAWNITTASPEKFVERSTELDRYCQKHGRDPSAVERSIAVGVLVGRDAAELRSRSRRMQDVVPPLAEVALDDVPSAARERGWIVGTPREVVATLDSLAHAGVDLAMLGYYDVDDIAGLELIADRVMPAFV